MIAFVNAKINLGLNIVRKREDGYHDLETFFYPVGRTNGTPVFPFPFCDILEIVACEGDTDRFVFSGRPVDCPLEKNLVYKAAELFRSEFVVRCGKPLPYHEILLQKHLPDGAGLGGGSADAAFTLSLLNSLCGNPFDDDELESMGLRLGADTPFFIRNLPAYAEGVGEKLMPVNLNLSAMRCVILKPDVYVSTKEAFTGVTPKMPAENILDIVRLKPEEWRGRLKNDFEESIFPKHPLLAELKQSLYDCGAVYASMSGSGSSLYGLFRREPDERLSTLLPPEVRRFDVSL